MGWETAQPPRRESDCVFLSQAPAASGPEPRFLGVEFEPDLLGAQAELNLSSR